VHEKLDKGIEENINVIVVMTEGEGNIELFEKYINGDLSDAELSAFEARLAYDGEFRESFKNYQIVEEGIRGHFRNELKHKLDAFDKQMDDKPKSSKVLRLAIWSSSVAAAFVIGIFIFQHFSQPSYQELAQIYWPHEVGLPVKMSAKNKYDDAMNAFKLEDWDKAENLLSEIESDTAYYFLGETTYKKGEEEKSISHFLNIEKTSVYYQKAQFRIALLFLIKGDKTKATEILNFLSEQDSMFSESAQKILEKID